VSGILQTVIEYSEFVGKNDPDLPPNIAFLYLNESERILPSGRRIDVFPPLNIRKGKGVPETRDERLSKYREVKEVVMRVKPTSINTHPKKRQCKLNTLLIMIASVLPSALETASGGGFKRENKMTGIIRLLNSLQ
jgi:hypothetical protein